MSEGTGCQTFCRDCDYTYWDADIYPTRIAELAAEAAFDKGDTDGAD